jgi:hemin uptake protein HemP
MSAPQSKKPSDTPAFPVTHTGLTLHSRELFRQGAVVQIRHRGQIYMLRLTRQDKLILTK